MDIFSTKTGVAVAVPSFGTPLTLILQGWQGYSVFKSAFNGFSFQTASGISFSHNLLDYIDAYTFGERISDLSILGTSFYASCETETPNGIGGFLPTYHGFEYVLEYYVTNRASSRGMPLMASIGLGTILEGFLTNARITMQDADLHLASFELSFKTIPQVSILD